MDAFNQHRLDAADVAEVLSVLAGEGEFIALSAHAAAATLNNSALVFVPDQAPAHWITWRR
ncbi:hypothetical protein [Streptacidiphilus sp. EB129]|uniref:hypothetical protein n=1 Tax=Streptacidiphilus sp. EB129 TaxID=3156262 RepID=UPI003518DDFD